MKDGWTCPVCYGQNAMTVYFCPCGEAHRDEKVDQVFEHPKERDGGTVAAIIAMTIGVIGTLALAYLLAYGI